MLSMPPSKLTFPKLWLIMAVGMSSSSSHNIEGGITEQLSLLPCWNHTNASFLSGDGAADAVWIYGQEVCCVLVFLKERYHAFLPTNGT